MQRGVARSTPPGEPQRQATSLSCFYCALPLERRSVLRDGERWTWLACPACGFEEPPHIDAS